MVYAMVKDGIVTNFIEADADMADQFEALPYYDACSLGNAYNPPREPTDIELTQQDITDLQLAEIEQGQAITDMELQFLEVHHA